MQELNNTTQFMQVLPSIMKNGGAIYHRASAPLVHLGLEEDINEDYCKENNIPIFRVQRTGGAIVSNVGDFDFVVVNNHTNTNQLPPLFSKLIQVLNSKGIRFSIENNDLLCEGYKVASYAYRGLPNNLIYTAMHISMSVNMDLIKNICKKEMVKVPRGLNDFGIYEEDILKLIEVILWNKK